MGLYTQQMVNLDYKQRLECADTLCTKWERRVKTEYNNITHQPT